MNTGSLAYARKTLASNRPDLTVTGDFRVAAEGPSGGNVPFIRFFDSAGNRLISLYRLNLNGSRIGLTYGGIFFNTSGTLALNTWVGFPPPGDLGSRREHDRSPTQRYLDLQHDDGVVHDRCAQPPDRNETAKQRARSLPTTSWPSNSAAPPSPPVTATVPAFDHIFVVVEENKRFDQIIGSSSAPYINSLASEYGLASNYKPITHPSLPNYLALTGGSTFGITTDLTHRHRLLPGERHEPGGPHRGLRPDLEGLLRRDAAAMPDVHGRDVGASPQPVRVLR